MSDVKLYVKDTLGLGAGDVFYASRPDGSSDGKATLTALAALINSVNGPLYAAAAHTHSYGDLDDLPTLFSGDYDDLTGKPTLGTAASANMGDFAAAVHTHTASQVTDFNTSSDARIAAAVGVTVQAYSANLTEYAGVNPTVAGLALLDDADATAQRSTLGLVIGTNVQAYDIKNARVASGAASNTGRISWGSSAPGTLDEGEIYLKHA